MKGETRYTTTLSVSLGGDPPAWEGEVTVCYAVTWGAPERPPAYDHGGLPADPDEVHDITVTHIEGAVVVGAGLKREAEDIADYIETNDALVALLLEHAVEVEAETQEEAAETRRDAAWGL